MDLIFIEYNGEYTKEVAQMQTDSYYYENKFIKILGLTKQQMYNEFYRALVENHYKDTLLFFERDKYNRGEREIVGCLSGFDAHDLTPPQNVDFYQVPLKTDVRKYMKYLSLKNIYNKYKPKEGEIIFVTSFAVNRKYLGKDIGINIIAQALECGLSKGYTLAFGNSVNPISQKICQKLAMEIDVYDLSPMVVLEDGSRPFVGSNLTQEGYLFDIAHCNQLLKLYLNSKKIKAKL